MTDSRICEVCQKHEASVHLHENTFGAEGFKILHLCKPCAKSQGIPVPGNVPDFQKVVSTLSKALLGGKGLVKAEKNRSCPDCGWSLRDFRQTSRFGCARDYEVFSDFVEEVLERVHGTSEHPVPEEEAELARLSRELAEAVQREDYESAARIRDRVRDLEQALEEPGYLDF